jgi:Glycosyl transferase family 2
MTRGYLERCTAARISGWAIGDGGPAELDVLVNGAAIARIRCETPRPDVKAGPGATGAGFAFVFSRALAPSDIVSVRFAGGAELANSPLRPFPYEGFIDRCTTTTVVGWATCGGRPGEVDIFLNDAPVARVACDVERPDLASYHAPMKSGFACLLPREIGAADRVSVRFPDGTELSGSPVAPATEEEAGGAAAAPAAAPGAEFNLDVVSAALASDFVDEALCRAALGSGRGDRAAAALYLALPRAARPDLSWFFDRRFYLESFPDIAEAGLDPLVHFITAGVGELRDPHPLIDLKHIAASTAQPFSQNPTIGRLLDFLTRDAGDPSPWFSLPYYRAQLEEQEPVPHGLLHHFLQRGIRRGLKPAPGAAPVSYWQTLPAASFDVRDGLRGLAPRPPSDAVVAHDEAAAAPIRRGAPHPAAREIHLYCFSLNEARIVPFFLRHYRDLVDRFFIFDNGSIDETLSLLAAEPRVSVRHFDVTGDSFTDQERRMSDTIWHQSRGRAAWVIMLDIDEFLYHPDLRGYLDRCRQEGITVIDTIAYEMVTDALPPANLPLTESVICGVREPFYDKLCMFDPDAIAATNYTPGRHRAAPVGSVKWPPSRAVTLVHYKRLGVEHLVERYGYLKHGLRSRDLSMRWGEQYLMSRGDIEREFRRFRRDAVPVPGLRGISALDLALDVDGRLLRPSERAHNTYTFHPPHGGTFRLLANPDGSPRPAAFAGVPVAAIFLRGATGIHRLAPDDPGLREGWLAEERIGSVTVRWTDRAAVLPIPRHLGAVEAIEVRLRWPLDLALR